MPRYVHWAVRGTQIILIILAATVLLPFMVAPMRSGEAAVLGIVVVLLNQLVLGLEVVVVQGLLDSDTEKVVDNMARENVAHIADQVADLRDEMDGDGGGG